MLCVFPWKTCPEITALNAVLDASKSMPGMTVRTVRISYGWDSSPLSRFSCPEKSALKIVLLAAVPALENSAAPLSKTVQMLYGLFALVNVPMKLCCTDFSALGSVLSCCTDLLCCLCCSPSAQKLLFSSLSLSLNLLMKEWMIFSSFSSFNLTLSDFWGIPKSDG